MIQYLCDLCGKPIKGREERRMKRISCIFGQHRYKPSEIELYLVEKKPHSNIYREIAKCMYCEKTNEQLIEIPFPKYFYTDDAVVEEEKHGKWIAVEYNDGTVRTECSICGYGRGLPPVRNYCPKCGARMDGE